MCIFNTVNDQQVYSGRLLKPELQISQLRLYIDRKNENHFQVVLSTLRPSNSDMNIKFDTSKSPMKNLVPREWFRQVNKNNISKTNKPKENKIKIEVPMLITRKSKKVYRKTEIEDTKMYQKKKDKELKNTFRENLTQNDEKMKK